MSTRPFSLKASSCSLFLLVVVGLSLLLLLHRWPFGLYRLKLSAVRAFIRKSLPDLRHL
jgi:hypothetical protein